MNKTSGKNINGDGSYDRLLGAMTDQAIMNMVIEIFVIHDGNFQKMQEFIDFAENRSFLPEPVITHIRSMTNLVLSRSEIINLSKDENEAK